MGMRMNGLKLDCVSSLIFSTVRLNFENQLPVGSCSIQYYVGVHCTQHFREDVVVLAREIAAPPVL